MLLAVAVGGLTAPADRDGGGRFTQPSKLRVVATYSILGDLVKSVAGDRAEVVVLVGPDGDAHTFDPAPQDGMTVADAYRANAAAYLAKLEALHAFGSAGSAPVAPCTARPRCTA